MCRMLRSSTIPTIIRHPWPNAPPPPPPPPPAAPDPAASAVGGAIVGGLLGGLISGRPEGAVAGAIAGGATGAIVGAQAASRPGYYWSQGNCYYRYPSGQYGAVDPDYCNSSDPRWRRIARCHLDESRARAQVQLRACLVNSNPGGAFIQE